MLLQVIFSKWRKNEYQFFFTKLKSSKTAYGRVHREFPPFLAAAIFRRHCLDFIDGKQFATDSYLEHYINEKLFKTKIKNFKSRTRCIYQCFILCLYSLNDSASVQWGVWCGAAEVLNGPKAFLHEWKISVLCCQWCVVWMLNILKICHM